MEFCIRLIFIQPNVSSKDTLCYIPLLFNAFPFILSFFAELRPTYYITPSPKRKPRSSRLLDKPAASDYNTKKSSQTFSLHISAISYRERYFFHGNQKTKQYLLITVVGVTSFCGAAAVFLPFWHFAAQLVDLVLPILAGGILALFINVPMTGLEKRLKRLFCKAKKQPSDKALHLLSFFITLLGVVLVLVLALTLLIPELVQSFHSLYVQIEANIPRWTAYLSAQDADMGWLMSWLEGIDWEQLLRRVTDSIDTVLVNAVGAVSATVNIVVTASFALIISVYMSVGSESLCHHARTLICAYLKPSHSDWLLKFCRLFRQSFANFLTGQCSEAVILGVLMALAFSVFKIPYGSLVGMLTAICAIIPYVGALISCVVSVFLVLLVDPVLAVRCLIVYLAVQFIENQFIYPRVVGKSVGLSPLYTLVAAMIGGELFGIIGIIFFIPLTAVIIELVKEDACRRIQAREPQRSGPSE